MFSHDSISFTRNITNGFVNSTILCDTFFVCRIKKINEFVFSHLFAKKTVCKGVRWESE